MSPTTRTAPAETSARILLEAQRLVQTRGFNGFSYADISAALGVTKASLHYHFPSKAELGRRLIEAYRDRFLAALRRIDATGGPACARLRAYVAVYEAVLAEGRMCLCGMLAAEHDTLPPLMQEGLRAFFQANEAWLERLLDEGRAAGELAFPGEPRQAAHALTGALEGVMLVARAHGGTEGFRSSAELLVGGICGPGAM